MGNSWRVTLRNHFVSFLPAACLLPRLKTLSRGRLLRLHWKLSHILFSLFSLFQNEDSWLQLFPEATANASGTLHCKKSITVGEPMFCSQDFFSFFFIVFVILVLFFSGVSGSSLSGSCSPQLYCGLSHSHRLLVGCHTSPLFFANVSQCILVSEWLLVFTLSHLV